jgi:hypothetical protein
MIGDRIGAKEKAYFKGCGKNDLTICTAWFPMIEVEGRLLYLKSDESPTGKLEAESLGEALVLARLHRDKYRTLLRSKGRRSAESAF